MTDQTTISIDDVISGKAPGGAALSPDSSQVVFSLGHFGQAGELPVADLWLAATDGSNLRRLTSGGSNNHSARWSPDGSTLAFISDRDARAAGGDDDDELGSGALYLLPLTGGDAVRITKQGFGVSAPAWSADGRTIAVLRTDPADDEDKRRKKERDDVIVHHEREKFSRLALVEVPDDVFGSVEVELVEPQVISPDEWHVWEFAWSPDNSTFALIVTKHVGFDEAFSGGRIGTLPASGGAFTAFGGDDPEFRGGLGASWSPDSKRFSFLAAPDLVRDSGEALYIASADDPASPALRYIDDEGTLLGQDWNLAGQIILLRQLGVYNALWTINPDSDDEPTQLQTGALGETGTIGNGFTPTYLPGAVSQDAMTYAVTWSDATHPFELWAGTFGEAPRQLTRFSAALAGRKLGKTSVERWRSGDLEIEGLLVLPVDYEEGKSYPTVLHIHGGPSWAWDDHFYANWHDWAQYLAGHGYAVLMPNPRGSTGRGWEFQIANYDDWMGADYQDSQRGLDILIERGIADPDRLAVGGWSYGGLTTAWTLTQTNRFKAAVLGAGVTNRVSMHGTTDIVTWHASWQKSEFAEATDEYWNRSAMRYIGQVSTPTLILHGEADLRVPLSQGWEYYNALKTMGVPTKMVIYPREGHLINEREHQRDLLERLIAWLDEYLKN